MHATSDFVAHIGSRVMGCIWSLRFDLGLEVRGLITSYGLMAFTAAFAASTAFTDSEDPKRSQQTVH